MPESMSMERRQLLQAYGAELVLTPAAKGMKGALEKAAEIAASGKECFLPQQFENPSNPEYHRNTTGPEILRDFASRRLDYFVSGIGTGGTITGAGEMLKKARPDIRIVYTEPANAPIVTKGEFSPHKIQGWNPDFVPAVFNRSIYDEAVLVTEIEARDSARDLAQKEGIFCGISSGGTFAAALKVAQKAADGSVLLAMLPDTGERYLTTFLFEGISDESDDALLP
jgi:cysteine synthase A